MRKLITIIIAFCLVSGIKAAGDPPSHNTWDELLNEHVDAEGNVDYEGLKKNKDKFYKYLKLLSSNHPEESWSKNEKMAYWINAYNAFTVQLVTKFYPIKSIMKIGGAFEEPFDVKFIRIEGKKYTLNEIEHKQLRAKYDEPRIHFAVNCASYSCPKLRNEAYHPDRLESQLQDQAEYFINNERYNKIEKNKVKISKLFDWYEEDFTGDGDVIDYINKYSKTKVSGNASIEYLKYNWALNKQY